MEPSARAVQVGRRRESLLYICYLGVTEPLVQTQVIPYLAGLASAGYGVVLLTFEPRQLSKGERRSWRTALHGYGMEWHTLRYHKRPALPATLADIVTGIVYAVHIIRARGVGIVHARGHVPAAMALVLRWLLRTRFVFDVRGLMADEYVDAGLWRSDGILYLLTKSMEALLVANADAVVVLTRRAMTWLVESGKLKNKRLPVEAIPCCVDFDRFQVDPARVRHLRTEMGFDGFQVMVYTGKTGGVYMMREMIDFYCSARRYFPRLRFLILTQSPFHLIEGEFARRKIEPGSYVCLRVPPEKVPAYLSTADFAISFIASGRSSFAVSPTKMAEYLATGLPVVYNAGIGDLDELQREGVGVVISGFDSSDYDRASQQMLTLLEDRDGVAMRCRKLALEQFSLSTLGMHRYRNLYASMLA